MSFRALCLCLTLSVPFFAQAEVRMNMPTIWQRAQVLPVGQQVWSLSSSYQDFSDQFSASGRVEQLGARLARKVTWDQLVKADAANGPNLATFMQQNGLNATNVAATATYALRRQETGLGLNWAYGLTSNWMIGVMIPAEMVTTHVQQTVSLSPQLTQGAGVLRTTAVGKRIPFLQSSVRQVAAAQLAQSGFERVPTQKQSWEFEDITLLNQFALVQGYNWNWSLQQMVRFPTAQNPSVDDYIQMSEDEGPIDVGLASLLDYRVHRWLLGLRFGYVAQLPDSASMRVGGPDSDAGVDPKVQRRLGDWAWGAVTADYHVGRRLVLLGEYSFLAKEKDHYSGTLYDPADYSVLAQNTDEQLSQAKVGLIYRLGDQAIRSGVVNKWVVAVDYTYPLAGRNAYEAPKASLELMNYF